MVSEVELKESCREVNMSLPQYRDEWHSWDSRERKELVSKLLSLIESIKVARDIAIRRYLPAFIEAIDELEGDLAAESSSEEEEAILLS